MFDAPKSVIGVALNFQETLQKLNGSFASLPYERPPQAPILYLKTPNTWIKSGQNIPCPVGTSRLKMAGTLGVVISKVACRVRADDAFNFVAGFTVVNDVSVPHESLFQLAIRERCSDSFCSIGEVQFSDQRNFEIGVVINNILRSVIQTTSLVRSIPELIRDISEFMTLRPGDILLVGEPEQSPLAGPGDFVRVEIPGIGVLENKVVAAS
jgi:5-oxopent-3-ene-1,2,5-tricarboxylate decarboxylase/2-hydroxyhepta-2,4-diene-1,7-dioate isomerase